MELPEVKKEFEGVQNMARVLCRSDASLDIFENDKKSNELDSFMTSFSSSPHHSYPISSSPINDTSSKLLSSANTHSTTSSTSKFIINSSNDANLLNENDETTPLTPNENNDFNLINNSTVLENNNGTKLSATVNATSIPPLADGEEEDDSIIINDNSKLNDLLTSSSNNTESIKNSSVHINNSNSKVKLKKNHQLSMNAMTERNRYRQKSISENTTDFTHHMTLSKNIVVDIKNAKFSWYSTLVSNEENKIMYAEADAPSSVLYVNKLKIPKGKLSLHFFMCI